MKKALLAFALIAVCVMYSNVVSANTFSSDNVTIVDVAPDPVQKIIDKINGWTTLTQDQMDQIVALSANYDWTSIETPAEFRAQVGLLKAEIRPLLTSVQFQEIKDSQEGN